MVRRFPRRSRDQWGKIASHRIISILRRHRLCNLRQLEAKISEAGPPGVRAQPLSIKDGLKYLLERGTVKIALARNSAPGITVDFYALEEFSESRYTDRGRRDFILEHWPLYRAASGTTEFCGDVLETLVDKALSACPGMIRLGKPGETFNNYWIDGKRFDNNPPLDHVVYYRERGLSLGLEDKNWREWIYPNDALIPTLLRKCLQNGYVPILITRKLPYLSRLFFKQVGALGFETHFMYLHPSLERQFELIRHKDGIGFADLRFSLEVPPQLISFFQSVVPKEVESTARRFELNRELIDGFLKKEISYYEFMSRLGVFPEIEPDDFEMWDYYDEYGL